MATGRRGVISALGGYHGHTGLALAAGDAKYREPFLSSSSDFSQVPFNDIEALKEALNDSPAAVIFETIPATLGMPIPGNDYYIQVKHLCEKNGTLLIIDEVQTGLGRTGAFWGIEHYRTVPDMIVTAKGHVRNGLLWLETLSAGKLLKKVYEKFPTFSGHISR